jgi:hypothetical protein
MPAPRFGVGKQPGDTQEIGAQCPHGLRVERTKFVWVRDGRWASQFGDTYSGGWARTRANCNRVWVLTRLGWDRCQSWRTSPV